MQMPTLTRHEKISLVPAGITAFLVGLLFVSSGAAIVHGILGAAAAVFCIRKGVFKLDSNLLIAVGAFLLLIMPSITAGVVLGHLATDELYKRLPSLKEKAEEKNQTS